MPIVNSVTYDTLITSIYNFIIENCYNIDSYTLPSTHKQGYSWNGTTSSLNAYWDKRGTSSQNYIYLTPVYTISSNPVAVVTKATVLSQLNSFMQQVGIYSNSSTSVQTKGILYFYNCVSSFFSAKLVFVSKSTSSAKYMCYNASCTTFPDVPEASYLSSNEVIEASEVDAMLNSLNLFETSNIKNMTLPVSVTFACSSSSSSSSSSCCSSSSSSSSCSCSSSWFIGYMKI